MLSNLGTSNDSSGIRSTDPMVCIAFLSLRTKSFKVSSFPSPSAPVKNINLCKILEKQSG